jgi:hypothetical protein
VENVEEEGAEPVAEGEDSLWWALRRDWRVAMLWWILLGKDLEEKDLEENLEDEGSESGLDLVDGEAESTMGGGGG